MNEAYYINTFSCEMISDKLFFISSDMNLVLEYLLDKDETILLPPPDEKMFELGLYGNIAAYNNSIFLIPFNANNMWKLCDRNRWEKVPGLESEYRGRFLGVVPMDSYFYLLGYRRKEIYKFNTLTYQIIELKIDVKSEILKVNNAGFLGFDYEIVCGRIFVPVMCANKILEIIPETDLINVIDVPSRSNGYVGIAYDGSSFWLAPRKGQYFVRYFLNGIVEEYKLPEEYINEEMYFGSAYKEGNYIIFTAFFGKNFKFKIESPNKYEVYEPSIYYCKALNDKEKVIHERNGQTYYVGLNGNARKLDLSISNAERLKYIAKYINSKIIITEGRELSFYEYLQVVGHYLP